jgi:hypothetical protein
VIELTPLGHACSLVCSREAAILCDPHFFEVYGQGLFVHDPPRRIPVELLPPLDLVFVSHRHRDHFDVRSLALLPRSIPIACANDPEILYCLGRLGFTNVTAIEDWQELRVKDLRLTFTPSLYRVPEHGLLLQSSEVSLWNMVDSVVDVAMIAQVKRLAPEIDLLLWPYQPLLETAAVENDTLELSLPSLERKLVMLTLIAPRHVMPYADGQIGTASAGWLNSYRFPADFGVLRAAVNALSRVTQPQPGQKLRLAPGELSLLPADVEMRRSGRAVVPKTFDTTRTPSAPAALEVGDCPSELLVHVERELTRLWQRVLESERCAHMVSAMREWGAVYDIVLELDSSETTFRFAADGRTPERRAGALAPLIGRQGVLRANGEVLWHLLAGSLHYISAYLGGAFRTWHSFYKVREDGVLSNATLNSAGLSSAPPWAVAEELPGPALFLNMMLASDPEIRLRVLEMELRETNAT